MANIRETKAERQATVEVQGIKEELSKAEREHRQLLDEEVRHYNRCLHGTSKAIHELLSYLESLSRIHGTHLLDEMRTVDVLGMITVSDDMQRLQAMGSELMQAVKLARSSEPSTGMHATTINV
jgi:triphosphoribosyl-dephospho-CoA synthetase